MRFSTLVLAFALGIGFSGCVAHRPIAAGHGLAAPVLTGDAAHPGATQGWVNTQLYFGLGPAGQTEQGITEDRWRQFLDREVTPRFPNGLSVVDVYGQWQGKNQASPERLRTKILIILYQDNDENQGKIDSIRSAWKQMTGDQSVLRVTQPADVSF